MGFNAAAEVDILDYDFTAFEPDVKGVTPEPSMAKVRKFQRQMKEIVREPVIDAAKRRESGRTELTVAELEEALSGSNDEASEAMLDKIIDVTAEVCSNKPTAAQIKKLPWRVQQHFLGYIAGKFLSGEASTPVTTL
jgi:hypothetical protein